MNSKFYTTASAGMHLLTTIRSIVPVMASSMHKGVCGRIGVVGGSKEYTGAPYFAAISALKVGADLSHVFCPEAAAVVIKSYSPDLIVHPILDRPNLLEEFKAKLNNLHALVIGPGLGRDTTLLKAVTEIINVAMELQIPIILDADGLFLILQDPSVISNYHKAILTPNRIEFERLYEKVFERKTEKAKSVEETKALAMEMGVTIVQKGSQDIITDGITVVICHNEGSSRRCGGQGDLLSGSLGTFAHWAYNATKGTELSPVAQNENILAAYAACFLTRECNRQAFDKQKRSMVTEDMIGCISQAFEQHFEIKC